MSELKDYIQFNEIQVEVLEEIIKSTILLGAKSDLIGSLASWGDSQTDEDTLSNIKAWNKWKESEINERLKMFNRCYD